MKHPWVWLLIAGLMEVVWAVGLKYTEGFSKWIPSLVVLIALAGSMYLLAKVATVLPIGTAYGVWVGIGAAGSAVFGILLFQEPISFGRVFFLLLLIVSVAGLRMTADTL